LLKRFVPEMRERVEDELGVRIPGVRIRSNPDLASYTYIIMLDEVPVAHGRVVAGAKYSPSTASALEAAGIDVAELEQAAHPLSNQPGWWIPQKYWDSVQQTNGCLLWPDPVQFLVAHLEAVLRNNLADFVGIEEVWGLLDRWGRTDKGRELVGAALPDVPARERFVRVLRALVRERAPVTDWESILLAVGEVGLTSDETDEVVRHVRLAIKPYLPGNRPGARLLKVPRELDRTIMAWVRTADGRSVLAMPPELTQELLTKLRELVQRDDPATVLVTEETNVRDPLGRLMRLEFPSITVQSQEETVCEEDRKTALAWVPLIAEWGEFWRQTMEACDAS